MEFSYNFGEIGSLVILEVIYLRGSESTSSQPATVGCGLQLLNGRCREAVRHEGKLVSPLLLAADGGGEGLALPQR